MPYYFRLGSELRPTAKLIFSTPPPRLGNGLNNKNHQKWLVRLGTGGWCLAGPAAQGPVGAGEDGLVLLVPPLRLSKPMTGVLSCTLQRPSPRGWPGPPLRPEVPAATQSPPHPIIRPLLYHMAPGLRLRLPTKLYKLPP